MPKQARFEVLLEEVRDQVKIVAEGHGVLRSEMRQMEERLGTKIDLVDDKVNFLGRKFNTLSDTVGTMERKFNTIDDKFNAMDNKFNAMDDKFNVMDDKFNAMDRKIDAVHSSLKNEIKVTAMILDERIEDNTTAIQKLDIKIDKIDQKLDHHIGVSYCS